MTFNRDWQREDKHVHIRGGKFQVLGRPVLLDAQLEQQEVRMADSLEWPESLMDRLKPVPYCSEECHPDGRGEGICGSGGSGFEEGSVLMATAQLKLGVRGTAVVHTGGRVFLVRPGVGEASQAGLNLDLTLRWECSWPLNNTGLNCKGPLVLGLFSMVNTTVVEEPPVRYNRIFDGVQPQSP